MVLRELGGDAPVRSILAEVSPAYRCPMCGNIGRLDRGDPASVVVLVSGDATDPIGGGETGARTVRLAHPGCSDSAIREAPAGRSAGNRPALPGAAWLRPADTDPAAVLVLATPVSAVQATDADATLPFPSTLLAHGFTVLSDSDAALSDAPGVTAQYTAGCLTVRNRFGIVAWEGSLNASQSWIFAALRARTIGLILAAGLRLDEAVRPAGWQELDEVIAGGHAIGAAVRLTHAATAGTPRPPLCGRPPRYDRALAEVTRREPPHRKAPADKTPLRLTPLFDRPLFDRSWYERPRRDASRYDGQAPGAVA